ELAMATASGIAGVFHPRNLRLRRGMGLLAPRATAVDRQGWPCTIHLMQFAAAPTLRATSLSHTGAAGLGASFAVVGFPRRRTNSPRVCGVGPGHQRPEPDGREGGAIRRSGVAR